MYPTTILKRIHINNKKNKKNKNKISYMPKINTNQDLALKASQETVDVIIRLRTFMFENHLDQRQLAPLLDCDYGHLSRIMNCQRNLSPRMLWKIIELLKKDVLKHKENENQAQTKSIAPKRTRKV